MKINAAGDIFFADAALLCPPHSDVLFVRHRKPPSGADPSFSAEFVCWSRDWNLPLRWVVSFLREGRAVYLLKTSQYSFGESGSDEFAHDLARVFLLLRFSRRTRFFLHFALIVTAMRISMAKHVGAH